MRILKWLVGGVALLLGGAFVWGRQRVSRACAARVEALAPCAANQLITGGPHEEKLTGGTLMAEFHARRPFVPFANASGAA
ncbi:hypothetical protein D7Y15_10815 [Corallococcus sp. AB030]|uniref:hypothetical protein n=1 Tax=Corallococcus TaxID=83461 RepID=UPI000EE843AB|nr:MULTISPECIES: hypothetical protein [Corallococcus]NRD53121.1 hypothetical protein [Corallococcus exiguus]RKI17190.1 hypothetical protein D7Y15_10815 [Corallococcus sp. AB030]RUO95010.1 hypothetical protein D7Y11_01635 [Corallococcus sp. AB018]